MACSRERKKHSGLFDKMFPKQVHRVICNIGIAPAPLGSKDLTMAQSRSTEDVVAFLKINTHFVQESKFSPNFYLRQGKRNTDY